MFLVVVIGGVWLIGHTFSVNRVVTKEIHTVDTIYTTIYKKDTLFKEVFKEIVRIDTLYHYTSDTTYIAVEIPIENSVFKGDIDSLSSWEVGIEGYNTKLLYTTFKLNYPTIIKDNTVYIKDRFNWGISVGLGFGVTSSKIDLFIGPTLNYNF